MWRYRRFSSRMCQAQIWRFGWGLKVLLEYLDFRRMEPQLNSPSCCKWDSKYQNNSRGISYHRGWSCATSSIDGLATEGRGAEGLWVRVYNRTLSSRTGNPTEQNGRVEGLRAACECTYTWCSHVNTPHQHWQQLVTCATGSSCTCRHNDSSACPAW